MNAATHMNAVSHANAAARVDDAAHVNEGRAFFIVINILIGVGVLMTVASLGVLVLAAVSG